MEEKSRLRDEKEEKRREALIVPFWGVLWPRANPRSTFLPLEKTSAFSRKSSNDHASRCCPNASPSSLFHLRRYCLGILSRA